MKDSNQIKSAAFAAACIGIATYSGMDVVMKGLALEIGAYNALLWRSMISVVLAGSMFAFSRPSWPSRNVIRLHVLRGTIISIMAFLFFWGLKYVPIAEAIALSFIAPLIALYLSKVLLHEQIGEKSIMASVIGLFGAVIIIAGRLGGDFDENTGLGIAAILLSAVMYAYNLILQRQQALMAGTIEIAFFQNLTIIILFSALAPFFAVVPSVLLIPDLAAAAVLGVVSLMMMSWAYARAAANTLIPVEYTAFVWAAIFGWLVFGEVVTLATIAGTLLIVVGCLVAAWQQPTHVDHVESTVV
jgi:S-adenosylmethionine uptake transporter